jgi:hypothetical protein
LKKNRNYLLFGERTSVRAQLQKPQNSVSSAEALRNSIKSEKDVGPMLQFLTILGGRNRRFSQKQML